MRQPEAEEHGIWRAEARCDAKLDCRPPNGVEHGKDITGTFRLPATPPELVGSGTVLEAASELSSYLFGVLRKRGQGTGPGPAGPYAAPRGFVLRPRAAYRP